MDYTWAEQAIMNDPDWKVEPTIQLFNRSPLDNLDRIETVEMDSTGHIWGFDITDRHCRVGKVDACIYKGLQDPKITAIKTSGYRWTKA